MNSAVLLSISVITCLLIIYLAKDINFNKLSLEIAFMLVLLIICVVSTFFYYNEIKNKENKK